MKLSTIFFLLIMVLSPLSIDAQPSNYLNISSNFTSRHYWRGIMVSNAANIETDLVFTQKKFKIGAWGAFALDNTYSEFDLHFDYDIKPNINISVWDLYASRGRSSINDYNYFNFNRQTTNHLINTSLKYSFNNKIPISLLWSTLVWGVDLDENKNQNFSSYFEVSYSHFINATDIVCYVGMNMFDNSLYSDYTSIVDLSIKVNQKIEINKKTKLNIWTILAINPDSKTANLIMGIGF